mgnify:CR=1 FL=1
MIENNDISSYYGKRKSIIEYAMYLIRDVLFYSELVEIKEFLDDIIREKKEMGYDNE